MHLVIMHVESMTLQVASSAQLETVDSKTMSICTAGIACRATRLQDLGAHIDQHGQAQTQQAAGAPACVAEERVPQPHHVWEGELLRQQQRDPAEGVELRVDLRIKSIEPTQLSSRVKSCWASVRLPFESERSGGMSIPGSQLDLLLQVPSPVDVHT